MVKSRASLKRLSTASQSTLVKGIDVKARRRIEDLFELTDEIINAYNEINEKYVHQIYRKHQQLKEKYNKLRTQFAHHHCAGCQCDRTATTTNETDEGVKTPTTTNSIITRSKKNNPFIISDIDETQTLNRNYNRFLKFDDDDDDDDDEDENDRHFNVKKKRNDDDDDDEEDEEEEEEDSPDEADAEENTDQHDEANSKEASRNKNEPDAHDTEVVRLPLALQTIIKRKAEKSQGTKTYLLEIVRFPDICAYLQDRSRRSFDLRPSEDLVRPFVTKYVHPHGNTDGKFRMRIRDELREIHRSYLRTFMNDPHLTGSYGKKSFRKSPLKKSPL